MSTLKRIADVVGCSVSTVSRAMNNCRDVSDETKKRVSEVARALGYYERKKRIKTENRKKNEFNIAIICPEVESDYYAKYIVCFSKHLTKNNHRTLIYNYAFDSEEQERLIEMCRDACNIDGIICLGEANVAKNYRNVPMALHTQGADGNISFSVNISSGIDEAIKGLGNKKGQSVLFVGEQMTRSRENSFFSVVKNYSNIKSNRFISKKRFEAAGCEASKYVLSCDKLPSLIICAYDEIALGLIEELSKNGIFAPRDLLIVGMNDIPCAKYCFGGLSTIAFDIDKVCEDVANELVKNIKNGTSTSAKFYIPTKFIKRNT